MKSARYQLILMLLISTLTSSSCNKKCEVLKFPDRMTSMFVLPFPVGKTYRLYQGYCDFYGHLNRVAYDFSMPFGAEITNSCRGIIIEIYNDFKDDDNVAGHNNRVLVQHEDGSIAWYGHLKFQSVRHSVGDTLNYGDVIGLCGTSGRSGNEPHLHFEVFSETKYDYNDAIPISFRNVKGKLDNRGALIRFQNYESIAYEIPE